MRVISAEKNLKYSIGGSARVAQSRKTPFLDNFQYPGISLNVLNSKKGQSYVPRIFNISYPADFGWDRSNRYVYPIYINPNPVKNCEGRKTPQNEIFQGCTSRLVLCETIPQALSNPPKIGFPTSGGRQLEGGPKNIRPPKSPKSLGRKFLNFDTMWPLPRPIIVESLTKIEYAVFEKIVKTRKSKNRYVRNVDPRVI